MTTPPIDLDHIKALMAKATPGERTYGVKCEVLVNGLVVAKFYGKTFVQSLADAEYAAESWNIMPSLIEELEAARKALGEKHE